MSFTVSRANSLAFVFETGAGTENVGANIEDNYQYEDIQTFFNCSQVEKQVNGVCQAYACDDVVYFQLNFSSATKEPNVEVWSKGETPALVQVLAELGAPFGKYTYLINFADAAYDCGGCYEVRVYSSDEAGNLFTQGDDGTHEASVANLQTGQDPIPASNNILTQSNTVAEDGTFSARIEAGNPATINTRLVYANADTSKITLTAGATYRARAYIYNPSVNSWVGSGNFVIHADWPNSFGDQGTPFLLGWTDCTVHSQTSVAATTTDTWQLLEIIFTVGAVTSGNLVITSDVQPTAGGYAYVDTVTLVNLTNVLEATSQCICIDDVYNCYQLLQWTNDDDAFGVDYSNSLTFSARIPMEYHQAFFENPDYSTSEDNDNTASVDIGALIKIKRALTGRLPVYQMEKLSIALMHDSFMVNQVEHVFFAQNPDISYPDNQSSLGTMRFDLRVKEYNYQQSIC